MILKQSLSPNTAQGLLAPSWADTDKVDVTAGTTHMDFIHPCKQNHLETNQALLQVSPKQRSNKLYQNGLAQT